MIALHASDTSKIPPLDDLFIYRDRTDNGIPSSAGAAMLKLIERNQFPAYALAFYPKLQQAGENHIAPTLLALITDDAILLAPKQITNGWKGYLIAEDTAINQQRQFYYFNDPRQIVSLMLPAPDTGEAGAVWAAEVALHAIP